jgi:hypothetical protein
MVSLPDDLLKAVDVDIGEEPPEVGLPSDTPTPST